jgi:rubrerythrin
VQISPRELRQLASDVDDMQREGMRTFREEIEEVHFGDTAKTLRATRRQVLGRAGAAGAALAAVPVLVPISRILPRAAAQGLDDPTIAAFAESVELAAVAAYGIAGGVLSAEVKPVAELFAQHHMEHAQAFGSLAGDKATGKANAKLVEALTPTLQGIKDQTAALEFAFALENQAAVTYGFALTALTQPKFYSGTATIMPIESAHAAALGMALGKPVPDIFPTGAFESADIGKGVDPAMFPLS